MKFVFLAFAVMLAVSFLKTRAHAHRLASPKDRARLVRKAVFPWVLGSTLGAAAIWLPNKHRLLYVAPIVLAVLVVARLWHDARLRPRSRERRAADLDKMKRVREKLS